MSERTVIYNIERDVEGIKCPSCGGFADKVPCTAEECKEFGCGRDSVRWQCCARAFVCCICKQRIVGNALAPECDW